MGYKVPQNVLTENQEVEDIFILFFKTKWHGVPINMDKASRRLDRISLDLAL